MMKKPLLISCGIISLALGLSNFVLPPAALKWKLITPLEEPAPRHENSFAQVGDQFYLFGGRNNLRLDAYDTKTNKWVRKADAPTEMNHFQAITYRDEVYVIAAFQGKYPHETPIPHIYIYNPKQDKWREGPAIPQERLRGSAGVTVYKDKIYVVSGITDGHYDGHVTWFDEYNPQTNTWRKLPDAPHARDHISVAVVDDKLVIAGGRKSTARINKVVELTVSEVDIYDFKTGKWKTLSASSNIPTQRAGNSAVTLGHKVLIMGGESTQKISHNQTEAFNVRTGAWETLTPMNTGRHGTGAVVYKNKVYIAAGSANAGGGPELNTMEVLE